VRYSSYRIIWNPLWVTPELLLGWGDLVDEEQIESIEQLLDIGQFDQAEYGRPVGRKNIKRRLEFTRRAPTYPAGDYAAALAFAECYYGSLTAAWGFESVLEIQPYGVAPRYFRAALLNTSHRMEMSGWETPEVIHKYSLRVSANDLDLTITNNFHPIISGEVLEPTNYGDPQPIRLDFPPFSYPYVPTAAGFYLSGHAFIPNGLYRSALTLGDSIFFFSAFLYQLPLGPFSPGGTIQNVTEVNPPAVMPLPGIPTGFTATALNHTSIQLTWTDSSSNELTFRLDSSLNNIDWTVVTVLPGNATSFFDTMLTPEVGVFYRLAASNASGYGPDYAYASATTQAAPIYSPPVVTVIPASQTIHPFAPWTRDLTGTFTSPDGLPLTYSCVLLVGALSVVSPLPSWISFDPLTQIFTGTPQLADLGSNRLRLTASDGTSSVSTEFYLSVGLPFPTLTTVFPDTPFRNFPASAVNTNVKVNVYILPTYQDGWALVPTDAGVGRDALGNPYISYIFSITATTAGSAALQAQSSILAPITPDTVYQNPDPDTSEFYRIAVSQPSFLIGENNGAGPLFRRFTPSVPFLLPLVPVTTAGAAPAYPTLTDPNVLALDFSTSVPV
jgi:Putative Ig domain